MSKLSKLGHFFQRVGQIAPAVLMFTPLAPIAAPVQAAIQEAEVAFGPGHGPAKLAHVVAIATDAANAVNAQAGKIVVDPAAVTLGAGAIISGIVQVVNSVPADAPILAPIIPAGL